MKPILLSAVFLSLITANRVVANEDKANQKYTIITSDGRTFLLNTETGRSWRYYFNNVEDQGWNATIFDFGISENKKYFTLEPEGDLLSYPVQEKKK